MPSAKWWPFCLGLNVVKCANVSCLTLWPLWGCGSNSKSMILFFKLIIQDSKIALDWEINIGSGNGLMPSSPELMLTQFMSPYNVTGSQCVNDNKSRQQWASDIEGVSYGPHAFCISVMKCYIFLSFVKKNFFVPKILSFVQKNFFVKKIQVIISFYQTLFFSLFVKKNSFVKKIQVIISFHQGPPLITWFNFNPCMDK